MEVKDTRRPNSLNSVEIISTASRLLGICPKTRTTGQSELNVEHVESR